MSAIAFQHEVDFPYEYPPHRKSFNAAPNGLINSP